MNTTEDYPYITLLSSEGTRNLLYQVSLSPDLSFTVRASSGAEALAIARSRAMDLHESQCGPFAED